MGQKMRLSLGLIALIAFLAGCRSASEVLTAPLDPTPRLAVVSSFGAELDELLAQTNVTDTYVMNGRTFYVGELAGNDVVLFLSGVSMVNATMMTQTVLDHFDVTGIVFSGIAGGVNPNLRIGDVTVPAQWAEYQEQLFAREVANGWNIGWHTEDFGNFNMMFPQYVEVTQRGRAPDSTEERFWFPVDPAMLEVARQVAGHIDLNNCTRAGVCLEHRPTVAVGGNGVSGPTFVDNAEYRTWVWETFEADALDMESAAVAHVAYVNDVSYIAFRSLSDLAGGGPGENEVDTFFDLAAENSATVVLAFLEAWAQENG